MHLKITDLISNKLDFQEKITLAGWVNTIRDHGNLVFIDLRDYTEILQCVISKESEVFHKIDNITLESVIEISGYIVKRQKELVNEKIATGEVELVVEELTIISKASQLPYNFDYEQKDLDVSEDLRLKYRFLDLRRRVMQKRIKQRSAIIQYMRDLMIQEGFMEMQTPLLTASSPEGAKDYLVPSSRQPGKFYALPQAPQVFKQLIMASGFEKYFQIAPCFRDEESRADRLPGEFYQLDAEMAFATKEDIFEIFERVLKKVFIKFTSMPVSEKFYRLTYKAAMNIYSSDKPDLRNKITTTDISSVLKEGGCDIFSDKVKALPVFYSEKISNSKFKELEKWAKDNAKMKGLGYVNFVDGVAKGPIAKMLDDNALNKLNHLVKESKEFFNSKTFTSNAYDEKGENIFLQKNTRLQSDCKYENGVVFFVSSDNLDYHVNLVRKKLGDEFSCIDYNRYEFAWITDFPFYEKENGVFDFSHNPFSMPTGGYEALINATDLLDITGEQYDIVCNGFELSSGAIRNHDLKTMYKAFELVGYDKTEVERRFGALVKAFSCGVPPHGGIAPGIDRIVMLINETKNLRENILFPLNQKGDDLLCGAPSFQNDKTLEEMGLRLTRNAEKKRSINS